MLKCAGLLGWCLLAASALTLTSCEESSQPLAVDASIGFIAFVGSHQDDPLWPTFRATAERYREGLTGFDLVTRAPKSRSVEEQIRILRELHSPEMRGLCIEPVDPQAIRELLCDLQTKGVAVVTMMQPMECEDPLPFSGVDELAVGRAIAEALREAVDGQGTVAILTSSKADRHLSDRILGFEERMRLETGLTVLKELDCAGDSSAGEAMVREYVERFPRLNAWAAMDNWPLRESDGERRLLPEGCQMVTTTPLPRYWPRLRDRTCAALIGARYDRIAESALRMCASVARSEPLQSTAYLAPSVTVTERNLSWFRKNWFELRERPADIAESEKTSEFEVETETEMP